MKKWRIFLNSAAIVTAGYGLLFVVLELKANFFPRLSYGILALYFIASLLLVFLLKLQAELLGEKKAKQLAERIRLLDDSLQAVLANNHKKQDESISDLISELEQQQSAMEARLTEGFNRLETRIAEAKNLFSERLSAENSRLKPVSEKNDRVYENKDYASADRYYSAAGSTESGGYEPKKNNFGRNYFQEELIEYDKANEISSPKQVFDEWWSQNREKINAGLRQNVNANNSKNFEAYLKKESVTFARISFQDDANLFRLVLAPEHCRSHLVLLPRLYFPVRKHRNCFSGNVENPKSIERPALVKVEIMVDRELFTVEGELGLLS